MKRRILTGLVILLVTLLVVRPAAADDPKPDLDVSELEKAGLLHPFGESSAGPKDFAPAAHPLSPTGAGRLAGSLMVYGFTYLHRLDTQVYSRAVSFTDGIVISEMLVSQRLCRNNSCTSWVTQGGANRSFVVAGWTWTGGAGNCTLVSSHYFRNGNATISFTTSASLWC